MDPILSDLRDNLQFALSGPVQFAQNRNRELREAKAMEREDKLLGEQRDFTTETAANLHKSNIDQLNHRAQLDETAATRDRSYAKEDADILRQQKEADFWRGEGLRMSEQARLRTQGQEDYMFKLNADAEQKIKSLSHEAQLEAATYLGTQTLTADGKPRPYNEIFEENKKAGVQFLVNLEKQKRQRMRSYLAEVTASRDQSIVGSGWANARRTAVAQFSEDPTFNRILMEKYPRDYQEKKRQLTLPMDDPNAITLEAIIGDVMKGGFFGKNDRIERAIQITEAFHPYLMERYKTVEDAAAKKEMTTHMARMKADLEWMQKTNEETRKLHPYALLAEEEMRKLDEAEREKPVSEEGAATSVMLHGSRIQPHYLTGEGSIAQAVTTDINGQGRGALQSPSERTLAAIDRPKLSPKTAKPAEPVEAVQPLDVTQDLISSVTAAGEAAVKSAAAHDEELAREARVGVDRQRKTQLHADVRAKTQELRNLVTILQTGMKPNPMNQLQQREKRLMDYAEKRGNGPARDKRQEIPLTRDDKSRLIGEIRQLDRHIQRLSSQISPSGDFEQPPAPVNEGLIPDDVTLKEIIFGPQGRPRTADERRRPLDFLDGSGPDFDRGYTPFTQGR